MFWKRSIIFFAPYLCFFVFLGGIACCLTEADEPYVMDGSVLLKCLKWSKQVLKLTLRPFLHHHSRKHSIQLFLVLEPISTNHRHPHSPNSPSKQWNPPQFNLGEPSTPSKHASSDGNCLNHIEICPTDMIGNNNGSLAVRKCIARNGYLASIEHFKYDLHPVPVREGYERRGIVDPVRETIADR